MAPAQMATVVADFLADLTRTGKSSNTVRAYRSDLSDFAQFYPGPIQEITARNNFV